MASNDTLKKELITRGSEIGISMGKKERMKLGRNVLARCVVICFVTAIIGSLTILGLPAQQTEGTVTVTVNAPAYVNETFNVTVRIDNVTELNAAQFDLSFDSSVVNVTEVKEGEIGGKVVSLYMWNFTDADTIRVIPKLSGVEGANGSGYLAIVEFVVVGKGGESSKLDISGGKLSNVSAKEINADWFDAEVTVLRTAVWVDAPRYVTEFFNATIRIENVTELNAAQFDLSFNSSVVNVTEVKEGEIDGTAVPLYMWNFTDPDTIRVISKLSGVEGANGSGYLAVVEFEVKGKAKESSTLDISGGKLSNVSAKEINADWFDAEVTVLRTAVWVDASAYVNEIFNATVRIENVTELNAAQFDLSFNSSVVNVTDVKGGEINGKAVPLYNWNFTGSDTIRVISKLSGVEGANGSGHLATVEFEVIGIGGESSTLDISGGKLSNISAKEITADWFDAEVTVEAPVFDTGEGTYPSIFGTHEGTITPSEDIPVQKMYTYPCAGTGGHSESVKIWNATTGWNVSATWDGYTGDYHNIVFSEPFTLYAGETYNYIIKTGSYPQIHYRDELEVESGTGTIRCTKFTDANGKVHYGIPAIILW